MRPAAAIINQRSGPHYFSNEDPLGKRITFDDGRVVDFNRGRNRRCEATEARIQVRSPKSIFPIFKLPDRQ